MVKKYHCYICGRNITAHKTDNLMNKVRLHGQQIHNIPEYSSKQLYAIRRKVESSFLD